MADDINSNNTQSFSYLTAAANHAYANGDDSGSLGGAVAGAVSGAAMGSAVTPILGTLVGGIVGGITGYDWKLTATSVLSGYNQLYNSGHAIMNILPGEDREQRETGQWIADMDSDLGQYYKSHQAGADALGFVGASMLPGLGAIKAYNMGAKALAGAGRGFIGAQFGEATGLLGGTQELYYAKALQDSIKSGAQFSMLNKNMLASIAAGAGEAGIQGLVFEAGVQIGLNSSPMLADQDTSDIASNLFTATYLSAGIGGVFGTALQAYRAKGFLSAIDKNLRSTEFKSGVTVGTKATDEMMYNYSSLQNLDTTPVTKIPDGMPYEDEAATLEALTQRKQQLNARAVNNIDDATRVLWQKIVVGKDESLHNLLHETTNLLFQEQKMDASKTGKILFGLESAGRVGTLTSQEKEVNEFRTLIDKQDMTDIDLSDHDKYALLDKYSTKYLHLWGEKLGAVDMELPKHTQIWNYLQSGDNINILKGNKVQASDRLFEIKSPELYDVRNVTDVAEANAHNLYALKTPTKLIDGVNINEYNLPWLKKAYDEMSAGTLKKINIINSETNTADKIVDAEAVRQILTANKINAANYYLDSRAANKLNYDDEAIANILNVRQGWLNKTSFADASDKNLFSLEANIADYTNITKNIKLATQFNPEDIVLRPKLAKLIHNNELINEYEQLSVPYTAYLKGTQKANEFTARAVVASILPKEDFDNLFPIKESNIRNATRSGAGGTTLLPSNGNYGSLASDSERIGQITHRLKIDADNKIINEIHGFAHAMAGDIDATMDYVTLTNKIASSGEVYLLSDDGTKAVLKSKYMWEKALEEDPNIPEPKYPEGVAPEIEIKTDKIKDLIAKHVELDSLRNSHWLKLHSLEGTGETPRHPRMIYVPQPNLRHFNHYAFVRDPQITSNGHIKMIWANDDKALEAKLSLIPEEFQAGIVRKLKTATKAESIKWHKAIGDYEADYTVSENYFDAALKRSGASSEAMPKVDPKLIKNDLIDWHKQQERNLIDKTISTYYSKEFNELKTLADTWDSTFRSTTTNWIFSKKFDASDNPYTSYVRTMLDKANLEAIPLRATQDWLDKKVSTTWNAIKSMYDTVVSKDDLDKINKAFVDAGINTVTYDAMNYATINMNIPQGALYTFSRRSNSLIAGIGLGLDALNAINNRVGQMVMLAPEVRYIFDAISKGDVEAVGELAGLSKVTIPGTEHSFLSPNKLIANAVKKSFTQEAKDWALDKGFSIRHIAELSDVTDILAPKSGDTALSLDDKITRAYERTQQILKKGAKITGNEHAEEMTRLTSALIMKDLTDLAVKHGHMSAASADSYIQTFVNRTNGVYLASQRPMMFNGPVGQAMGLYQTYLMQIMSNLFRYTASGYNKSAALMMGLQGSIYGMSSLPAFNAINTHLVGSYASNHNHRDIYSAAYSAMDKNAADWLMFGGLSNVLGLLNPDLKINMYTRGDINPRNISIIPLNPADYPAVNTYARFFGNLYNTFDQVAMNGGKLSTSLLSAIEHNGISRPLTGLAQALGAFTNDNSKSYSTTAAGTLIGTNDLMGFMNLARVAGAKPLDEAKLLDESYRNMIHQAKDEEQIKKLGSAIKSQVIGGINPSQDDLLKFQHEYVMRGGKQEGFNSFMTRVLADANYGVYEKLTKNLKSEESKKLQLLMGGREFEGFGSK